MTTQTSTDDELELHIKQCGDEFLKAHEAGDLAKAHEWLAAEVAAVNARSPEQVARMESCYFSAEGLRARQAALLKAA